MHELLVAEINIHHGGNSYLRVGLANNFFGQRAKGRSRLFCQRRILFFLLRLKMMCPHTTLY